MTRLNSEIVDTREPVHYLKINNKCQQEVNVGFTGRLDSNVRSTKPPVNHSHQCRLNLGLLRVMGFNGDFREIVSMVELILSGYSVIL
ncbi:unnamed protein product [Penicillium nalgiovense]|nr:unnamed protein product [Penicillium nalgiovense]